MPKPPIVPIDASPRGGASGAPIDSGRGDHGGRGPQEDARLRDAWDRLLGAHMPLPVFLAERAGESVYFNRAWRALAGEPEPGASWLQAVHAGDHGLLTCALLEGLRDAQPFSVHFRLRDRDGRWRRLRGEGVPLFDPRGQHLGMGCYCMDISDGMAVAGAPLDRTHTPQSVPDHRSPGWLRRVPRSGRPGTRTHVLVVDRDRTLRLEACDWLERGGFEVSLAPDGAQGLARLRESLERGPAIDLVLLEVRCTAEEDPTLSEMLRLRGAPPVVALGGADEAQLWAELGEVRALACADILSKPLERLGLLSSVRRALRATPPATRRS